MFRDIGPEEEIVLLFSRTDPSREAVNAVKSILTDRDRPVDYDALERFASINGVSQLLYHNLRAHEHVAEEMPEKVMDRLRDAFLWTVRDNTTKALEMMRILTLLKSKGIESIPLKGAIASDIVLGNPGLYPSGDIDILVRPSDLEKTGCALREIDYRGDVVTDDSDALRGTYHLTFQSDRFTIEVHWTLAFRYFEVPPDFWWEETRVMEYEGGAVTVLSTERYLLYTIFRLYSKAFRPLRFFVLPSEIIRRYRKETDWPKLLEFAKRYRMRRLVLFTLKLLHDLLGAGVPSEAASARLSGYGFLRQFVMSGLFGDVSGTHIRMLVFTVLQDTPLDTMKVLLRRVFPDRSEIRLRYGLSHGSGKVYLYYLFNPLFLLLRKGKRRW